MVIIDTVTREFEPFNDNTLVEVKYKPGFSQFVISSRMPDDMEKRLEDGELIEKDFGFVKWIVDDFSNQEFDKMVNNEEGYKLAYVVNLIFEVVLEKEITPWESFNEEDSFVDSESLGVR